MIKIKRVPTGTVEQWNMVGARIKIMWEEQLVDPPYEYIIPPKTNFNHPSLEPQSNKSEF